MPGKSDSKRDPRLAALLAALFGLLGIMGIGHIYIGRVKRGLSFLLLGFIMSALAVGIIAAWRSTTPNDFIWKCEWTSTPYNPEPEHWNASGILPPPGATCRYERRHTISEIAVPLGLCWLSLAAIWILQVAGAYLLAKSPS